MSIYSTMTTRQGADLLDKLASQAHDADVKAHKRAQRAWERYLKTQTSADLEKYLALSKAEDETCTQADALFFAARIYREAYQDKQAEAKATA